MTFVAGILFVLILYLFYLLVRNEKVLNFLTFLLRSNLTLLENKYNLIKHKIDDPGYTIFEMKLDYYEADKEYEERKEKIVKINQVALVLNIFKKLDIYEYFTEEEISEICMI